MKHKVKKDIIKCKKKLENSIKALEEKIFRLETEYHKNCNVDGGNLLKGWDNYLRKAQIEPLCFKTFRDDYSDAYIERILSLTSCTSPANALFQNEHIANDNHHL
ncbi:histone acetyltransferase subunit NuA4, putative [Plasmodium vinckei vinckei]|uniref:Histone acetyltransferase subunit NuA4, putative n=1 Tax=Plasmodium vinckei vinckei TaxID=54757 RepID=A0A449C047_PLAVN|nr:histone acetyltransferase subunit NuA4, putative [Plasmodium vinckei vinckei]KEG04145.1 hypothetical protein YYE_01048 [Plasmodium vinckei vinckei]VEV59056.1 histone acetyltransferase subunit NuA4, putative [Plasmodium vinckei vinckei]